MHLCFTLIHCPSIQAPNDELDLDSRSGIYLAFMDDSASVISIGTHYGQVIILFNFR